MSERSAGGELAETWRLLGLDGGFENGCGLNVAITEVLRRPLSSRAS